MNNFNLYLDNLVDQGYDITLMKYYFELIYSYKLKHDNVDVYVNEFGYVHGYVNEFGDGHRFGFGYVYGDGYD